MQPNGYVHYQGPSLLDQAPIVVVSTGHSTKSANTKTGDMIQTWILRADVEPHVAIKTGQDTSICGDCIHRGENGKRRTCYVQVQQGPLSIYRAWKRGIYPTTNDPKLTRDRMVRIGAYGDPAAAPLHVWRHLTRYAKGWTGYTHQWQNNPHLQRYCMASVDSPSERSEAIRMGWRTFHVVPTLQLITNKEINCPASKEVGAKTNCAKCKLCAGTTVKAPNIAIQVHGIHAKSFTRQAA